MKTKEREVKKSAFFKPVSAMLAAAQLLISSPSYSYQEQIEGKSMAQAQKTADKKDQNEDYKFVVEALKLAQKKIDSDKPINGETREIVSTAKGKISQNLEDISPKEAAELLKLIANLKTRNVDKSINDSIMEMERLLEKRVDKSERRKSYEWAVKELQEIYEKFSGGPKYEVQPTDLKIVKSAKERILRTLSELDAESDVVPLLALLRKISNVKDVPDQIRETVESLAFALYNSGKVIAKKEKGGPGLFGETLRMDVSLHTFEGRDNFKTAAYLAYNKKDQMITCKSGGVGISSLGYYVPSGQEDNFATGFGDGLCKQRLGDPATATSIGQRMEDLLRQGLGRTGNRTLRDFGGDTTAMNAWLEKIKQGDFGGALRDIPDGTPLKKEVFSNFLQTLTVIDVKQGSAIAFRPTFNLRIDFNQDKWEKWANSDIMLEKLGFVVLGITAFYEPLILSYEQSTRQDITSATGTTTSESISRTADLILSRPGVRVKMAKGFTPEYTVVMDVGATTGGAELTLTPYLRAPGDREPKKGYRLLDTPALSFRFDNLEVASEFIGKGIGESKKVLRTEPLVYAATSFVASFAKGNVDLTLRPSYIYMQNKVTGIGTNETGGSAIVDIPVQISDRSRITFTAEGNISQNILAVGGRVKASLLDRKSKGGSEEAMSFTAGYMRIFPSKLTLGLDVITGGFEIKTDILK
ncbi:MAG: hypothetical protein AABX38_05505 [Candidatus Micrarchaeota archaeon]